MEALFCKWMLSPGVRSCRRIHANGAEGHVAAITPNVDSPNAGLNRRKRKPTPDPLVEISNRYSGFQYGVRYSRRRAFSGSRAVARYRDIDLGFSMR